MNARAKGLMAIAVIGASSASAATVPQLVLRAPTHTAARQSVSLEGALAAGRTPPIRRVIIRNQLILRIPLQPRQTKAIQFQVLDAPRCFATRAIGGARLSGARSIDFLMPRERRIRVHMDSDCKSLDFYGGFYLQPTDEKICAGRDVIRTRMGGNCKIDRFQLLEPIAGSLIED